MRKSFCVNAAISDENDENQLTNKRRLFIMGTMSFLNLPAENCIWKL